MTEQEHKPIHAIALRKQDAKEPLFRRAAEATRTSQLLINQTEELLARTQQLLEKSEPG